MEQTHARRRQWPEPLVPSMSGIEFSAIPPQGSWVSLDGHPVFPLTRFSTAPRGVGWPGGVRLRLHRLGRTRVGLVDPAGRDVATTMHDFGGSEPWRAPQDEVGRPLQLNKWGWFDLLLGQRTEDERSAALRVVHEVIALLADQGLPAWIAGGTALGAVRTGELIDHDDDLDIAYLSAFSDPVLVAQESFRLERLAQRHGFRARRFSAAHFQIVGWPGSGSDPIHVDVFSAFFRNGWIHQPFHIRGPLRRDQLLPLRSVALAGTALPVPRDTNAWLTLNYGSDWATPQPDHRFVTPAATRLLFTTWFGQYLRHVEYWHERSSIDPVRDQPSQSALWLRSHVPAGTPIIELGSGDGVDAAFLTAAGFGVLAVDYCLAPTEPSDLLELPRTGQASAYADVSDSRTLLCLAAAAHRRGGAVHVHARNLLDQVDAPTRRAVLGLLAHLPAGSTLSATVRMGEKTIRAGTDPTDGRLSTRTLAVDATRAGLQWRAVHRELDRGDNVLLIATRRNVMHSRTGELLRGMPRTFREVRDELVAWRRMPVRLAELEDLVESQLLDTAPPGTRTVEAPTAEPGSTTD